MLQHIAVGVDASEAATAALRWVDGLVPRGQSSILAIHCWEEPFVSTYKGSAPSVSELVDTARAVIRDARQQASVAGNIDSVVLKGSAGPTLVEHSRRCDLVAVGRKARGLRRANPRLGEVFFGSTARYVIRHSTVPVAVVPEGTQWRDDPNVLVGIDGSPASLEALRWAIAQFPHANLHAVQGIEHSNADFELVDARVDAYRRELDRIVRDVVNSAGGGRDVVTHIAFGEVTQVLVDPSWHAEIVVIGAPPTVRGQQRLIGSVSNYALNHSPVPLIVVPQAAHASSAMLVPHSGATAPIEDDPTL